MSILEGTSRTADGGLHELASNYINWKVGDPTIVLDGNFTVAELQWLIDYVSSKQSDSAIDDDEERDISDGLVALYPRPDYPAWPASYGNSVSDMRVYNRALTAAEIWQEYANG